MINKDQEIIYVGKARNLKKRVRQYFQASASQPVKVRTMMNHVKDLQIIVTDTEVEALILECNLIKEYRPKYNVLLRDDKSYPYIKITLNETYPRVIKTRNMIKDGSKYFGPYTDTGAVNETLDLIRRIFPIKSCNRKIDPNSGRVERPCLNFHIRHCLGPCRGSIHIDQYLEMIRQVDLLLSGKETELQRELQYDMREASQRQNYEKAAVIRDQLTALNKVTEKQKMDSGRRDDQDVIAAALDGVLAFVQVFTIREGKIVQQHNHSMTINGDESSSQIISSFIKQFYYIASQIPSTILLEEPVEDQSLIEQWLSEKGGRKTRITIPQRGEKRKLIELVKKNAQIQLEQRIKQKEAKENNTSYALTQLQKITGNDQPPIRIESIDISHTAGVESVGSLVVFIDGRPSKKDYRRFRIRSMTGPDDPGSIHELLSRRIKKTFNDSGRGSAEGIETNQLPQGTLPDLFLIDGGSAQVSVAEKLLADCQLAIPVLGMIKDDRHRTRWLLFNGQKRDLKTDPRLWRFITSVQDEAHRFAVGYHQQRRSRQMTHSEIETIPGIGEKRRKQLQEAFHGIGKIKRATVEELASVPGISKSLAQRIRKHFDSEGSEEKESNS